MANNKHLFSIDADLVKATSVEEIFATASGLEEVGLFAMPFNRDVYIEVSQDIWIAKASPEHSLIFGPFGDGQVVRATMHDKSGRLDDDTRPVESVAVAVIVESLQALLVVLLATRNAVKRTTENKLAKLGIGKGKFASVTTISLPSAMDIDPDNPPKGGHYAPHLRRGHVRKQRYGKENAFEKVIWIESVFVNADPDFVASRTRYRIRA